MSEEQSMVEMSREELSVVRKALASSRRLVGVLTMAGHISASPNLPAEMDDAMKAIDAALNPKGKETDG